MSHCLQRAFAQLLFLSLPAAAGLTGFSLDYTVLTTPPGGIYQPADCRNLDGSGACVIFTGAISFSADTDYTLTGITVAMNPANPDAGTKVFDNNGGNYFYDVVPGTLGPDGPGYSYNGGLFEVDIAQSAALGSYLGTATLQYQNAAGDALSSSPLSFQVLVTPEPAAFPVMLTALGALAAFVRRRNQTRYPQTKCCSTRSVPC